MPTTSPPARLATVAYAVTVPLALAAATLCVVGFRRTGDGFAAFFAVLSLMPLVAAVRGLVPAWRSGVRDTSPAAEEYSATFLLAIGLLVLAQGLRMVWDASWWSLGTQLASLVVMVVALGRGPRRGGGPMS